MSTITRNNNNDDEDDDDDNNSLLTEYFCCRHNSLSGQTRIFSIFVSYE